MNNWHETTPISEVVVSNPGSIRVGAGKENGSIPVRSV